MESRNDKPLISRCLGAYVQKSNDGNAREEGRVLTGLSECVLAFDIGE
jgi:hypothetical protein